MPVTRSFVEKLRTIRNKLGGIKISFGAKLSTIAGAAIASVLAEANFNAVVRWTREKAEAVPQP